MCVYCGERPATTRDHVIPQNLFLPPRPGNLITVRCCKQCNTEKQPYDDLLRDLLAFDDITNQHPESRKLFTGPAGRAMDRNRSKLARKIKEKADILEMRSMDGQLLDWSYVLRLNEDEISELFVYVAKGLTFHEYGVRLPYDAIVEVAHVPLDPFTAILRSMRQTGRAKGPTRLGGDTCVYASLFEDEYHAAWTISFFNDRWFGIFISHPDDEEDVL